LPDDVKLVVNIAKLEAAEQVTFVPKKRTDIEQQLSVTVDSLREIAFIAGDIDVATVPRAFRFGVPALGAFPFALWSRLTARRCRDAPRGLASPRAN